MSEYKIIYKSNNNVVFSCKYHVVWCPKYRRDVLVDGADARLKEIIRQVCFETDSEILEMEVMPDHVHLLVEVDPQFGVHIWSLPRLQEGDPRQKEGRCVHISGLVLEISWISGPR